MSIHPFISSAPLSVQHTAIMNNIIQLDNMLTESEIDDPEVENDMNKMCQQLGNIEEIMFLKHHVECDCFYNPNYKG